MPKQNNKLGVGRHPKARAAKNERYRLVSEGGTGEVGGTGEMHGVRTTAAARAAHAASGGGPEALCQRVEHIVAGDTRDQHACRQEGAGSRGGHRASSHQAGPCVSVMGRMPLLLLLAPGNSLPQRPRQGGAPEMSITTWMLVPALAGSTPTLASANGSPAARGGAELLGSGSAPCCSAAAAGQLAPPRGARLLL